MFSPIQRHGYKFVYKKSVFNMNPISGKQVTTEVIFIPMTNEDVIGGRLWMRFIQNNSNGKLLMLIWVFLCRQII